MSAGAHAAPRIRPWIGTAGPLTAGAAVRRALLRTGTFGVGLAATFSVATVVASHGGLDAFATVQDTEQVPSHASVVAERQAERVAALASRYDCSASGLVSDVIPAHAVVRVGDAVRLTTFDRGWAVYEGKAPGTLVSVCAR
jgi:hypothetical protein